MKKNKELKAIIAGLNRKEFEGLIGSSTKIKPQGVILESENEEQQESSGFEIRSSEAVDLWDPESNFALTLHGEVLMEVNIDPLLIAHLYAIPSESPTTVDTLIQMFGYPLTAIEAVLFAAFVNFIHPFPKIDEDVLNEWGRLDFQSKMEKGFNLLRGVLRHSEPDSLTSISAIQNEWSEINEQRRNIHDQFADFLENGTQS
jgi:hypothetical protein